MLRVPSNFALTLARGVTAHLRRQRSRLLTARPALGGPLRREGIEGPALVRLGAGSAPPRPRHWLLVRRHLRTGELAFHYCHVPEGQPLGMTRLVRAAGLRWPVEEDFEFGKDCFGLDQSQVRLYTAIARHTVLVMAALAICAVTAALLRRPHRHPGATAGPARPAAARRPRDDPADRPGDPAPARRRNSPPSARPA